MRLDFDVLPFSYAGSYFALSYPQDCEAGGERPLALRVLYGLFGNQENFPFYLVDEEGTDLVGNIEATETELVYSMESKRLQICFQNEDTIWIRSNAAAAITKRHPCLEDRVMEHDYGSVEIAALNSSLVLNIHRGGTRNESKWNAKGIGCSEIRLLLLPDDDGIFECQLSLSDLSYREPQEGSYEASVTERQKEYQEFKQLFVIENKRYQEAMEEAVYINWHSIVKPAGFVKYPVMLMSKNMMNQVWSWDYAINALAMVDKVPQLAYEQFLAMEACQDEYGAYADCFQAQTIIRRFVKPPVQGFILRKMFVLHSPKESVKKKLYHSVAAFTNWWFTYRGRGDGIPEYHHGNDSGWDNSTVFYLGLPVKSPDLCAWLVDQMDFLSDLAGELGIEEERRLWKNKSDDLLEKMLDYFMVDDMLVAYKEPEHQVVDCESLLLYIPLILGDKLPQRLRENMLSRLLKSGKYKTDYGIASEPVDTKWFVEDGYWRGAIWPPTALIFSEIFARNGLMDEAVENAKKFCDLCRQSGFYENYSALDGRGLRDSGFTWTASTFMILLREFLS